MLLFSSLVFQINTNIANFVDSRKVLQSQLQKVWWLQKEEESVRMQMDNTDVNFLDKEYFCQFVRKDMDENEHERPSKFTLTHKVK